MIVEGAFVALTVLAWRKASSRGRFTPARQECYLQAMEHLKDADKLRELADAFDKQGLSVQAYALRKRADLRGLDAGLKAQHRVAFEQGMVSQNIEGVLKLARAFESITATETAKKLRAHALDLRLELSQQETAAWHKEDAPPAVVTETEESAPPALETKSDKAVGLAASDKRRNRRGRMAHEKGEPPALKSEEGRAPEEVQSEPAAAVHGE